MHSTGQAGDLPHGGGTRYHRVLSPSAADPPSNEKARLSTGVPGLDEVLDGGLLAQRSYLVRGGPGSGKTMLGLHFLSTGVARGGAALFIAMSEPESSIRANAMACGFQLEGVNFLDLSPTSKIFTETQSYDVFSPAEVERDPMRTSIREMIDALKPQRIFLDTITQFRYLSPDPFQFRKHMLSLLRFLVEHGGTALFTSEAQDATDEDLQFISDGIIQLNSSPGDRSLRVTKFRGSDFRSGCHSMRLSSSGMEVFPQLMPEAGGQQFVLEALSSGIAELDQMLGGGIERGTITIVTGPSGAGKSSLGMQFLKQAAERGEHSVVYVFEESIPTLLERSEAIRIPVRQMMERGLLSVVHIEPLRFTADQFAVMARREVEEKKVRILMIDSIAGYRLSLRGEDLVSRLHALAKYLQKMGVAVLLINEVETITGDFRVTELGVSYMADNIIFLRYLEMKGGIHKAIGVLKKRLTDFEKTVRELDITSNGLKLGKPLTKLRGILQGTPEFIELPFDL